MEVTLTIPDNIVPDLQNGSALPVSRRILELTAIKAYEADLITGRQVQEMLGFDCREDLYAFFKAHDVRDNYTIEDLEKDRATLSELLRQHNR